MIISFAVKQKLRSLLLVSTLPIVIIVLWEIVGRLGLTNSYLLPSPSAIWLAAVELWERGHLQRHLLVSVSRVLTGFSVSASLALSLAALHHGLPVVRRIMSVPMEAIRVVPPLAMVPVLILWLGIGEASKLAIIVLASFFPIYLSARTALASTDTRLLEMAKTLRLSRIEQTWFIVIPSAMPGLLTGLRLGFGYAWRALVGAEMIAAAAGLGYLIIDSEELARTDRIFVGIFAIAATGLLLDAIFLRVLPKDNRSGMLKGVF